MKLSDIKGERTLDVIADLIDPITNIAADKEAAALFQREKPPEGMDAREFVAQKIKCSVPTLLKEHKTDIIAILSTIEGTSPEEYANGLSIAKLTTDFVDLFTDGTFSALFTSAQTGGSSGSAQVNTAEQETQEPLQDTRRLGMKGWLKRIFTAAM